MTNNLPIAADELIYAPLASESIYQSGPCLLADIGGTNARFALALGSRQIVHIRVLACADYPDLKAAIAAYLAQIHLSKIEHAAIAIANPVNGDEVRMTNHHWCFSIEATRNALALQTLLVINDFTALAMSLPYLSTSQYEQIGTGQRRSGSPMGLLGAGTGLGVSAIIPWRDQWFALQSEGGHRSFSPSDKTEMQLLEWLWQKFSHVSAERLASGPGIVLIYQALIDIYAVKNKTRLHPTYLPSPDSDVLTKGALTAREIVYCAHQGDALCIEALRLFSAILGSIAGDLALTLGSTGGVYIGGGVVNQLGTLFDAMIFRQRFTAKGRFSHYLEQIPTYRITAKYPAFIGISMMLEAQLNSMSSRSV